ncbi:hypothetical protein DU473_06725 [Campylobacter novaezeelandiae]|uniref:Uncharacterized protein n=1 Tax=Campylobacter novaezeelandiae TaxID=2267891 RepID=A0A4Q9JT67_9BACT|nr:hypothetical protein [Campylobacter novaezeelandiae]TBR79841.1 hypothetical protein DU473_06725 [Campylobacter novaezeelandiae]
MKKIATYHSKIALSDIIPFSDRRKAFVLFAKKNNFILEKKSFIRGFGFFISINMLKKLLKIYNETRKTNIKNCLSKAFLDIENFLKDKK